MPLLDVQRRYRTLGRIRLGQKGAKGQPEKLDTFRLTSPKREYLEAAAALYGGTVQAWEDAPAGDQWELVTGTNQIDVLVPPQRIGDTQSYALWTGGGLVRRCDGAVQITGDPCACDPAARECKPVTHLLVMLPRLPDLGVWRLTTTGFNAAAELPMTVDLLSALTAADRAVPASLMIEHRTSKTGGKTRRYVVPTLGFTSSIDDLEEAQGLEAGTLRNILTAGPDRAIAAASGRPKFAEARVALPDTVAPIPTPDDSVAESAPPGSPSSPGGSAAEIRTAVMGLDPSEALTLAHDLLGHRPATAEAMPVHQVWVRRLFYAMERPGLWQPGDLDPLHMALQSHYQADHLADLRRGDLLIFCDQAADAATAKLGEQMEPPR